MRSFLPSQIVTRPGRTELLHSSARIVEFWQHFLIYLEGCWFEFSIVVNIKFGEKNKKHSIIPVLSTSPIWLLRFLLYKRIKNYIVVHEKQWKYKRKHCSVTTCCFNVDVKFDLKIGWRLDIKCYEHRSIKYPKEYSGSDCMVPLYEV